MPIYFSGLLGHSRTADPFAPLPFATVLKLLDQFDQAVCSRHAAMLRLICPPATRPGLAEIYRKLGALADVHEMVYRCREIRIASPMDPERAARSLDQ